jgi:hypothetical protein
MDTLIFVGLAWVAMSVSFVAGCMWNSGAWERGFDDGYRAGFDGAIGKDPAK